MRWGRVVAGILLAVVISGCTVKSLSSEAQKGIQKIGVISAIGDELLMQNVPYFAWDQAEYAHPIASWGLDDHVADKVAQLLGTRYTATLVQHDGAVFYDRTARDVGNALRALPKREDIDAYVIVLKGRGQVGLTRTIARGVGVVRFTTFSDRRDIHALYQIVIVDARSFEVLGSADAVNPGSSFFDGHMDEGPHQEADEGLVLPEEAAITASQEQAIRKVVVALIDQTAADTLRRVKLIQP
jgi:hypothetical protein